MPLSKTHRHSDYKSWSRLRRTQALHQDPPFEAMKIALSSLLTITGTGLAASASPVANTATSDKAHGLLKDAIRAMGSSAALVDVKRLQYQANEFVETTATNMQTTDTEQDLPKSDLDPKLQSLPVRSVGFSERITEYVVHGHKLRRPSSTHRSEVQIQRLLDLGISDSFTRYRLLRCHAVWLKRVRVLHQRSELILHARSIPSIGICRCLFDGLPHASDAEICATMAAEVFGTKQCSASGFYRHHQFASSVRAFTWLDRLHQRNESSAVHDPLLRDA